MAAPLTVLRIGKGSLFYRHTRANLVAGTNRSAGSHGRAVGLARRLVRSGDTIAYTYRSRRQRISTLSFKVLHTATDLSLTHFNVRLYRGYVHERSVHLPLLQIPYYDVSDTGTGRQKPAVRAERRHRAVIFFRT